LNNIDFIFHTNLCLINYQIYVGQVSNIIFLDLPAGTGFSYPKTEAAVQQSTWKLVHNAHQFLRKVNLIFIYHNSVGTDLYFAMKLSHGKRMVCRCIGHGHTYNTYQIHFCRVQRKKKGTRRTWIRHIIHGPIGKF
jgi:hypothetical protein